MSFSPMRSTAPRRRRNRLSSKRWASARSPPTVRTHQLGAPFMVIATQNPIEHEGTYALPEAQLDRFLMRISIGYPARDAEQTILESQGGTTEIVDTLRPVVTAAEVREMSASLENVYVAPALRSYLLDVGRSDPPPRLTEPGALPSGRPCATTSGARTGCVAGAKLRHPDDVSKRSVALSFPHRLLVTPEVRMRGVSPSDVVTENPRRRSRSPGPSRADMADARRWGVLAAGFAFVAAGRVVGGIEFYVPGAAAIVAVVAAVLPRRLRPSRIADFETTDTSPESQPANRRGSTSKSSTSRRFVRRSSDFTTRCPAPGVCISPSRRCRRTPQPGAHIDFRQPRRGVIELGPTRLDDVDPLGLARRSHHLDSMVRLIVHPLIEAVPVRRVPAGDDPLLGEELRQSLGLKRRGVRRTAPLRPG